jgi:hypothetical protein
MFGGDEAMSSEFIDAVNAVMSESRLDLEVTQAERFEWKRSIEQLDAKTRKKMSNSPVQAFVNAALCLNPRSDRERELRDQLAIMGASKLKDIRDAQKNLPIWLSELVQNAVDLNATELGLDFNSTTQRLVWWHDGLDENGNSFSSRASESGLEDLQSLINIGSSNKGHNLQSTGKFGLGFKYWVSWWDRVSVIADDHIISWKLADNKQWFEKDEDYPASKIESPRVELRKKTIFVFDRVREISESEPKISLEWNDLCHILHGLTAQPKTTSVEFTIDSKSSSFRHILEEMVEEENSKIVHWKNLVDGEFEKLNVTKKGVHVYQSLNSFPPNLTSPIMATIRKEVDLIKLTLDKSQADQLQTKLNGYLAAKKATLTYIVSEGGMNSSPISNLFPITQIAYAPPKQWKGTKYIFDAPFMLTKDRQKLKDHYLEIEQNENMNQALFGIMLQLYQTLVKYGAKSSETLRMLKSLPQDLFTCVKSIRSCDFSFEDARIWPLKGGTFSTLSKTCGIPLRTELTDFINGRELQSPPSDEDLEFLDNVNALVHDSEVYCPNEGNGVVDSWVLQQQSSLANMLDESRFWGQSEVIVPKPEDFFFVPGFENCKNDWKSFLPLPIQSYVDGTGWLFPEVEGTQNQDTRIKLTQSVDEIREKLTSDACKAFLAKLEELEGDVLIYLHEDYRECILKHPVLVQVKNRPGVMSLHSHKFLLFDQETQTKFYGSLLSEGFRCRGTVGESDQLDYLIPETQLVAHFQNHPQEPKHWPVFAKDIKSSKLVMFEEPSVQRYDTYVALTSRSDKAWPTYWSLNLNSSDPRNNIWNGNGFQSENTNTSTFGRFATRRGENADIDLIYFSHWPKGLATIAEQVASTYHKKVQSWNHFNINTHKMIRPRPQQGDQPVSFVHVELVSNTNAMRRFIDEHPAMQVPGFILPYHIPVEHSKLTFDSSRITSRQGKKFIEHHNNAKLTSYNQNKNDWLRVIHNRLSQSVQYDDSPESKTKFMQMDSLTRSSFNSNTRAMSLTHIVLDLHLSGGNKIRSGLSTKQALLFCASHQNIQNGEFTSWESWIEDFGTDKKRKVIMHSLGGGNLSHARPFSDDCYNELRLLSPLGFTKNITDFAADVYAAIGNNWMLFPPYLSFDSIPRSGMEFIQLDAISESETAEDRAQRYEHGLQWLFSTQPEKVQSFFTDYLQSLKTIDLQEQINGLLLIATTMLHAPEDPEILIQRWITEETIPFTKEQAEEIRNFTVSDAAWTDKSLIETLDLILGQSEEHGLMLHTLDKALIDGLDINKLQFNDYYIVRNGELNSSIQVPKYISSHDNPLWISKQDLQEICGINLKHGTQHRLTSRFLLDDRDAILTFERPRLPKIPEDANCVMFEQVHNFKNALHNCCTHLRTPERNHAISQELDEKYQFIQTWLRARVVFDLLSQNNDSTTNIDGIESELFQQLTALKVEKLEEGTTLVDGVKIGKHGYRLEWSKESGFKLQIGHHERFIHTLICVLDDLKREFRDLPMELPYQELVNELCRKGAGILAQEQVEDFLKHKPRHNLWSNPETYKDEHASLSELLRTHGERKLSLMAHGWKKDGIQGASKFLEDRITQWEEYTHYKSVVDEVQPLKPIARGCYPQQACMNLAVRPAFTSYDESESLYPNKIYRLIKPDRSTSFGHRPEHWPATPDFLGNCLFLSSQTFDRMRLNPEPFFFHADPEHLLTQLRLTFESKEFEGPENHIKVTRALNVTEESVDDANLLFEKFHLLEMLAFLKGTQSLRRE